MTMSPSEREVQVGDIVQVSYRPAEARETLGVRDAQVTAISQYGGARTMQLSTVNGHPILKGDSGGGIWFEGRLVGNMWASFYDAATDTPTANGFAAFLPFGQV
jgi:hypothetical protein